MYRRINIWKKQSVKLGIFFYGVFKFIVLVFRPAFFNPLLNAMIGKNAPICNFLRNRFFCLILSSPHLYSSISEDTTGTPEIPADKIEFKGPERPVSFFEL